MERKPLIVYHWPPGERAPGCSLPAFLQLWWVESMLIGTLNLKKWLERHPGKEIQDARSGEPNTRALKRQG